MMLPITTHRLFQSTLCQSVKCSILIIKIESSSSYLKILVPFQVKSSGETPSTPFRFGRANTGEEATSSPASAEFRSCPWILSLAPTEEWGGVAITASSLSYLVYANIIQNDSGAILSLRSEANIWLMSHRGARCNFYRCLFNFFFLSFLR